MMRMLIALLIVLCAQPSFAEIAYFDLVEIQEFTLVSRTEKYILSETCEIKNKAGDSVPLAKIKMPTTVKADVVQGNNGENIIMWLELIDAKNNARVPE